MAALAASVSSSVGLLGIVFSSAENTVILVNVRLTGEKKADPLTVLVF